MPEPLDLDALLKRNRDCSCIAWDCDVYHSCVTCKLEAAVEELRATRAERDQALDTAEEAIEECAWEHERAERAEAAIARVRGWIEENGRWDDDTLDGLIAALDGTDV